MMTNQIIIFTIQKKVPAQKYIVSSNFFEMKTVQIVNAEYIPKKCIFV